MTPSYRVMFHLHLIHIFLNIFISILLHYFSKELCYIQPLVWKELYAWCWGCLQLILDYWVNASELCSLEYSCNITAPGTRSDVSAAFIFLSRSNDSFLCDTVSALDLLRISWISRIAEMILCRTKTNVSTFRVSPSLN